MSALLSCCGHSYSDHRAGVGCVARIDGRYCTCAVGDPRTVPLASRPAEGDPDGADQPPTSVSCLDVSSSAGCIVHTDVGPGTP